MSSPPPGWHPDPFHRYDLRYFNGTAWTADVSAAGHRTVDPLGTTPTPAGAAGVPPAFHPGEPRPTNGAGVAAMVLGIVAAATAWAPFLFVLGAVCGVLAVVFALVARRRRDRRRPSAAGTVGLVLGPIAVVLAIGGLVLTRVVLDVVRPGHHTIAMTACERQDGRQVFEGTIRNDTGRTRSYTINVEFLRAGTSNVLDRASVDVNDVGSGDTAPWSVNVPYPGTGVDCQVDSVTGALTFLD